MNGVHDMGGQQGFGRVVPEAEEPPFHNPWEGRAMGLVVAIRAARIWNIDQARQARESIPPATYLASSYYKIWIEGLSKLLIEHGMVTRQELSDGRLRVAPLKVPVLSAKDVLAAERVNVSCQRPKPGAARFAAGDRVRTKNVHPRTHTRLPRYCRDKPGTIARVHGPHIFPDSNALGREDPQWLYNVRFEARDLWGPDTTASAVYVDLWEPYLV